MSKWQPFYKYNVAISNKVTIFPYAACILFPICVSCIGVAYASVSFFLYFNFKMLKNVMMGPLKILTIHVTLYFQTLIIFNRGRHVL